MGNTVKTVLVTGASGSLGHAVVERFLGADIRVIGTHHLHETPNPSPSMSKVEWVKADLADVKSVSTAFAQLPEVHALVHCAGGFRWAHLDETSEPDFDFLITANIRSAFSVTRALLPGMKQRRFGRIVYVSAKASLNPPAGMGAYAASKAALNAMTLALAEEVKGHGITVNAVLPTILDTPANRKEMPKADFSAWVSPTALAEIIFSMTQPWGDAINGALIPVAGRV